MIKNSKELITQIKTGDGDDIKEYVHLLEQYKAVVDETNIVSKTDSQGIITYTNDKFSEISGYERHELIGRNHNIIRHPEMPARAFKSMWDTITSKKVWHGVVKNLKKDGGYYIVEATIIPILDTTGAIKEYIAIRKDITRLIEQRRTIRRQTTDSLTGLANYTKLMEDVMETPYKALVLFNIDMFHAIVDFYGDGIANNVLVEVAKKIEIIKSIVPGNFNVYKMVGDEFVLFSSKVFEISEFNEIIQNLYNAIMKDSVITLKNIEVHYAISIGAYLGEDQSPLNKARIALKHSRQSKKGCYLFDEKLTRLHYKNFNEVMILRQAISQNRIVPYYQPIIDVKSGQIQKFESLARLTTGGGGIILPKEFLETAKRSKLYPYITSAVIKSVLEIASMHSYEFSINLSVEDIVDKRINEMIVQSVKNHKGNLERLIFEITESENIDNFDEVEEFINCIKGLGCKIAIDDFGSGYSNFEYLARLNIDYVKVDGSLIKNLSTDPNIYKIVHVITEFAKEMGYKTVAEYIENEEIFNMVKELEFDYCQGYYIGPPEAFDEYIS